MGFDLTNGLGRRADGKTRYSARGIVEIPPALWTRAAEETSPMLATAKNAAHGHRPPDDPGDPLVPVPFEKSKRCWFACPSFRSISWPSAAARVLPEQCQRPPGARSLIHDPGEAAG